MGKANCSLCVLVLQAFNVIDSNRDGFIDNEDLKDMLASLGMWGQRDIKC